MGWLICIAISGVFGTMYGYTELSILERLRWRNYLQYTISWMIVVGFMTAIFGGVISGAESGKISARHDPIAMGCQADVVKFPIVSTIRERTISGHFILGTGGINSINKYYAYVEREHGLKLTTFYVRDTYIKEGSKDPHYTRTDYMCERTFRNWFWFGTKDPRRNYGDFGVLHVPTGTVFREFRV